MISRGKYHNDFGWRGYLTAFLFVSSAHAQQALPPSIEGIQAAPSAQVNQSAFQNATPPIPADKSECPGRADEDKKLPVTSDFDFTIGETILLSIFNKHAPKREFTPLYADTFFSDGWCDPHIAPPETTGGSVRQGWAGLNDVFFNRMIDSIFNFFHGSGGKQNQQVLAEDIETPISRRLMVGVIIPYLDSLNGDGQPTATSIGDTMLESRINIVETQDLTITANINFLVPTGSARTGNDHAAFRPYLGWYKDLGYAGWSFRGMAGINDPLNGPNSSRVMSFDQTVGLGQTLTKHDVPLLGDFTYYLIMNTVESESTNLFLSLAPGIRSHLGRDWYLLAGVEFPVTANAGYNERVNLQLVKGF